ncbi:MAG: PEGA domain-containing protein [Myxococcales bacterium]|nr:PEGA domain-containing protein [Myxococcales bacterium]
MNQLIRGVAGALVVLAAATASAQPSSQFLSEFQAGTDAYRLGDYDTARAHLERAVAIDPSLPGPSRFLAAVDVAESKWEDCIGHARTAIIANPASSEIIATRKLHDDCRAALGRAPFTGDYADGGALLVLTNISGAALTIGGLRAGATPLPPRPIALGPVEVVATKAGWKTARGSVTVIPGVVTDLELVLEEEPTSLDVVGDPVVPDHGWLRLDAPVDAAVIIDSAPGVLDERGRYQLSTGEHAVEVSAPGYLPYRTKIRVQRGQEQRVRVPRDSVGARATRRRNGTIALGTAAGLGALGAVTGWMAMSAADEARDWATIERQRPQGVPLSESGMYAPVHTRADIEARGDRSHTLGLVSGVAFAASAAALATGIYFLVKTPTDTPVEVGPVIGDGWGVAVRGVLP